MAGGSKPRGRGSANPASSPEKQTIKHSDGAD